MPSTFPEPRNALWLRLLTRVEEKLDKLHHDTPIQQARREISRRCREAADRPGGIYRLNVPTGGGKTLASLRFALAHAVANNKSRVIFTSPLLSPAPRTYHCSIRHLPAAAHTILHNRSLPSL